MLDFHTHILPNVDDASQSVEESVSMIREELRQGVDTIVLTPHFYAKKTTPRELLAKRDEAFEKLSQALSTEQEKPKLLLGSEVHYYMGIGRSNSITSLQIANSGVLLLELPFENTWSDSLFRDVRELHTNLGLQVVIAHVERYVTRWNEKRIIDQLMKEGAWIQANAAFFINPSTQRRALRLLKQGRIQVIGSDCHGIEKRIPNMVLVEEILTEKLGEKAAKEFLQKPYELLGV